MKLVKVGLVLAGWLIAAAPAMAQQDDKEQLKKKILEEVEKKLKAEEEKLLKDIAKLIDEEFAKWKKGEKPSGTEKPKKEEPKKEEPKKEEPKPKKFVRGFLGITLEDVSDEDKKSLGIEKGVRILEVGDGTAAQKAGLKNDDIILTVDGKSVDATQDVRDLIGSKAAGTEIKVKVLRDKKEKTLTATLARHPDEPAEKDEPKKEEPKKEEPKKDDDLRNRIKKFLDKENDDKKKQLEEKKKKEEPKAEDDTLAFDETTFEQIRGLLEQFGMDPESYFEKGKDGKWRPNAELRDMLKQFDFKKFLPGQKDDPKTEEPKKEPKKEEPKKEEPKKESAKKAWLGIVPEELSDDVRAKYDIEEGVGFAVGDLSPGSPAEKLLKKDDIVTKINGKAVKGEEGLAKFIKSAKAGQEIELTVLRKGREQTVKVTLSERKD